MPIAQARYVSRAFSRIYPDSHCLFCGANCGICLGELRACRTTVCKACNSAQCMVNGLARGQCGICLIGFLPGWGGNERLCGYKGCSHAAIAHVKRNKYACYTHCLQAKINKISAADYIARAIRERDQTHILKPAMDVPLLERKIP